MRKRPLLAAAVVVTMAVYLLSLCFPSLFFPELPFEPQEVLSLQGTVTRIDMQGERSYVFLSSVSAGPHSLEKAILILSGEETETLDLKAGNTVDSDCVYRPFSPAVNYGNFDEKEYYASQGIFLRCESRHTTVSGRSVDLFRQTLNDIRNRLVSSVYEAVEDEETAGILTAICTGDRSGLTRETRDIYRKIGIIHVLAISGLHISLLGMSVFRLLRKRLRYLPSALISSFLMICFCLMCGASASAVRATIMFLIQMAGACMGKRIDMLSSLSAAALLMLLYRPLVILNSAFVLSFAAILGVCALYPALAAWFRIVQTSGYLMKEPAKKERERTWRFRFRESLLLSLSVHLTVLPVTASIYFEISVYSVLLNLLVIPAMSLVLGSGLACAIFGVFRFILGRFFAGIGVYLVQGIRWCCDLTGRLPWNVLVTGHPETWRRIVYYGMLLGLVLWIQTHSHHQKKEPGQSLKAAAGLGLLCAGLMAVLLVGKGPSGLRISMLDVGQGESILIESPSGTVYLIDGGSTSVRNVGTYRMEGAIGYYGISNMDAVVITHPDTDHISGLLEILEDGSLELGSIWIPEVQDNENYLALCELASEKGVPVHVMHAGVRFTDGNLVMTCLHPGAGYSSDSANGYSAVLDIRYGEFTALLTGDLEADGEQLLLSEGFGQMYGLRPVGYDLLKVAHHGSRFSSSATFLQAVSPDIAVISAGARNVYGHPHEETLERLQAEGTEVFVTAECGEIILDIRQDGNYRVHTKLGNP